ncbi:MAG: nickel-responsive transcriptional regulator NikR [Oligoflexia bacterium]|nr:nickel-responsive transcriptional regulator NikR [Oligoflexia bacterium]
MNNLVRFGVSLDKKLLDRFDKKILRENYPTRSKAIADLITRDLVSTETEKIKGVVAGTITLVFDHHKRKLLNTLTDIQHKFHNIIISSQHVHLDHHNCLEIIVVKGKVHDVENLSSQLKTVKGVICAALNIAKAENTP